MTEENEAGDWFQQWREEPLNETDREILDQLLQLPNPANYFGGEILPDASTFEEFVKIRLQSDSEQPGT